MTDITSRRDTTDADNKKSAEEIAKSTSKRKSSPSESPSKLQTIGQNPTLRGGFVGLEVVHISSGRIRVQAKPETSVDLLNKLAKTLDAQSEFTSVTVNKPARSLVVKFDERQISAGVVLGILKKLGIPDMSSVRHKMPEDPFATWKSADFWREQGIDLIPLLLGLAVTGRLGINGFAAIPVYLITAEAARKVISYLQPQVSAFLTSSDSVQNPTQNSVGVERSESKSKSISTSQQASQGANQQNPLSSLTSQIKNRIKAQVKSHLLQQEASKHQLISKHPAKPQGSASVGKQEKTEYQTEYQQSSSTLSVEHQPKLSTKTLATQQVTTQQIATQQVTVTEIRAKQPTATEIGKLSVISSRTDSHGTGTVKYSIIHSIPGRVRFHVPKIGSDRVYARNLETLLKADSHVISVRINPDAASVAIAYQTNTQNNSKHNSQLNTSYWVNLLNQAVSQQSLEPQARSGTQPTTSSPVTESSTSENLANSQVSDQSAPKLLISGIMNGNSQLAAPNPGVNNRANYYDNTSRLWTDFKSPALSYSLDFMANFPLD